MFECVSKFFKSKNNNYTVFDKQYRNGYNKLWINKLRNYCP